MSIISDSMAKKGYIPLAGDARGGIGINPSLADSNDKRLSGGAVWFDTGQRMKDSNGKEVPFTVAATSIPQYERFVRRGWKPLQKGKKK